MNRTSAPLWLIMLISIVSCVSGAGSRGGDESEVVAPGAGPTPDQQEMSTVTALTEEHYSAYVAARRAGPIVPGIFQAAVPQGMAYSPQSDLLLISNYMDDGRQSCITAVSLSNGMLQQVFWLEEPDGSPHSGHVGGLAVSQQTLWVASGPGVFHVSLDNVVNGETLRMDGFVETATKGSFATFADGALWVGEFTRSDGSYRVPRSHNVRTESGLLHQGWMAEFPLDPVTDLIETDPDSDGVVYPNRIISIPHEVQGAAFWGNTIVLSHSYGRQNKSRISIYRNPMEEPPWEEFAAPSGRLIPVWVLDDDILSRKIMAPPMSEGIVAIEDQLLVLFESGSDKYRETALDPLDRIQILDLRSLRGE